MFQNLLAPDSPPLHLIPKRKRKSGNGINGYSDTLSLYLMGILILSLYLYLYLYPTELSMAAANTPSFRDTTLVISNRQL